MTTHTDTKTFDVASYVAAIEGRDAQAQLAAFTDDAELVVIDHDHTPSNPRAMRGTDALREYLTDVCSRDMTHRVTTATVAGDRLTIELGCQYSDGTRVACLCVSGLEDSRIAWQRGLQAWDH